MTLSRRFTRFAPTALVAAIAFSACLSTPTAPEYPNPVGGRPVLFIGNSLTYVNDLPVIVQGLADAAKGDSLWIAVWASPNAALIDHWNGGGARASIESGSWDFVVLQQGPSAAELNRDTLRLATQLFAPSITFSGAKAVLFSVWPTSDRRQDFERSSESYRLAAQDVGGIYAPVSQAWLKAWEKDPTLPLYSSDGLHPTIIGSYLAALVIYAKITDKSPVGIPATLKLRNGSTLDVPQADATLLQQAAWEAVTAANLSARPPL